MPADPYTVYAAVTTGPYYMTQSRPNEDRTEALREAVELQQDEVYSAIVAKITVNIGVDHVEVETSFTKYDGDEACRIIEQHEITH